MRKFVWIIASLFVLFCSTQSVSAFSDINTSFYRSSIESLVKERIISWYGNGTFWPHNTITRAEILKMLFKLRWIQIAHYDKPCFPDVKTTDWYHPYVCEWVKRKIVSGFSDGNFGPNMPVTILEALAMWLRMYDIAPLPWKPWYLPYRDFADMYGVLKKSSYSIQSPMTRWIATDFLIALRSYVTTKEKQASLSIGCGNSRQQSSGEYSVFVNGVKRSYRIYVPQRFEKNTPWKLIFAIHGRTNSNAQVQGYMWLERQQDFIVVYPEWEKNGKAFSWSNESNILMIDTMLSDIWKNHCIDRSEIYIVAHSLGAWFASKLSCVRWDVFRGMAIVGGGWWSSGCNNTPTATLIFQNQNDPLSPSSTARVTESKMSLINTCSVSHEKIQIGNSSCYQKKNCSLGNPVIWCENYETYGNDPHSWPRYGWDTILWFFRSVISQ